MADKQDDYRSYVTEYPVNFECPVCLLLMKDPHIVSCCGKKFCEACILRVSPKHCPICKQEFSNMPEKELQRQILNLTIECNKEGCKWAGDVRNFESHLANDCLYSEVDCDLDCGSRMQRKDLPHHRTHTCPKRSIEAQLASITEKLEKRVMGLEEICARQSKEIKELKTELCVFRKNTVLPRFTLSTSPMNEFWYSPSFYSSLKGYKLRFKCSTTYPVWMGQYNVNCQLQLLNGEHDAALNWPVHIEAFVEVTARHQCSGETLVFKFTMKNVGRPKEEGAVGNRVSAESQTESLITKFHQNRAIVGVAFYSADITVISVLVKPSD